MNPNTCRHYNGNDKIRCLNSVRYTDVQAPKTCYGKVDDCIFYETFTEQEIDAEKKQTEKFKRLLFQNKSMCCNAEINTDHVIKSGSHKWHGSRFCSKCGKFAYKV